MPRSISPVLIPIVLLTGCTAMAKPQRITPRHPAADVVIAEQVVAVPADDQVDAAPSIQAAINDVAKLGGGVVFLPAGRYRLNTPLVVKEGVTLRGDWAPPTRVKPGDTTLLMVTAGRGSETGPAAITAERGSGLRELSIWYPQQSAEAPVPYPWAIAISTTVTGDNMTVLNCTLVNPWLGIKIGPEWNELHTIQNVYGTPLSRGVFIDTTTDIGRLTDVDFGPRWWAESGLPGAPSVATASTWLKAHATGVDMGRSDWEYVFRLRVTGYQNGMVIRAGAQGTTNAVMYGCELTGGAVGLRVEALNGVGLACTGCRFGGDTGLLATDAFKTVLQLNTCHLEGRPALKEEGSGTITLQHGTCGDVAIGQGSFSALDADLGRVALAAGVQRARVLGCRVIAVDNQSAGDVAVSDKRLTLDRPVLRPVPPAPIPRPMGNGLWSVADFGAATNSDDNTAAFQQALDAAGKANGGTVYVPGGRYRLKGHVTVPSGVELRGTWDVPHHTQSGGAVLLPLADRGKEDGTPTIQLQPRSGVRGLLIWYPEQNLADPVPYPWAVRSLGPGCWAVDLTIGNGWQGVDFGTHPSAGHVVRYLAGGYLRRGLYVSKCDGPGWIEDTLFNPHYTMRIPGNLSHPAYTGDMGGRVIEYQRAHLEGIVVGRCADEHIRGTFLYAGYDGLSFRDDGGGAKATVLMHGSDTVSRSVFLEAGNVDFHLTQLTPLSDQAVAAFVTDPKFTGRAAFYNSQIWAGTTTALIQGKGEVVLSQFNTLTGPLRLEGGRCRVVGGVFSHDWLPEVTVGAGCEQAQVLACLAPGAVEVLNQAGERAWVRANSATLNKLTVGPASALSPDKFKLSTSFEPGQPMAAPNTVATPGGGIHTVSKVVCAPVAGVGRDGSAALRLSGNADDPAYSFVYCRLVDGPLGVWGESVLSYWIRPENERGRDTCVDIVFTDGSTLRDSTTAMTGGGSPRGAGQRAKVGEWAHIEIPLAEHAGKVIAVIMVAYDSRSGGGPFSVLVDDLRLEGELATGASSPIVAAVQNGKLELALPTGTTARYTLDGTNPTKDSPEYKAPVAGSTTALNEIRWRLVLPSGNLAKPVGSKVW